ncbi:hypothetical protein AB3S75_041566 [Citrus x aurantiifolia]
MAPKALNNTQSTSSASMHHFKTKMRGHSLVTILLAWLLLSACQQHYSNKVAVQAVESVEFQPGQVGSRSQTRKVLPSWVERKKIRKSPSGPNPVGNQHPPSRH